MSNQTLACPAPFISSAGFSDGGYSKGRLCGENPFDERTYCCLPCPAQEWMFSDDFLRSLKIGSWLSVPSLIPLGFLLVSWVVLDSVKSHRHYLSVGLVAGLVLIQLAFIIPLASKPDLCFDAITPKDMHNSLACAWSGACFQAGGISAAVWIVLRSLWFHIRVCWDRSPGKIFLIGSLATGILVPTACLIAATAVSGYSYRFGTTCIINHEHSFAVFWGWLLAFAGLAFLIQCTTTGYAAGVYLRTMALQRARNARPSMSISSGQQKLTAHTGEESGSPTNDLTSMNDVISYSHLRWRKLRAMFVLQWRQVLISVLVVVESVYFVVVFWSQERRIQNISDHQDLQSDVVRWSLCLINNHGDKEPCLGLVKPFLNPPSTTLASYILSASIGLQVSLILIRRSHFREWLRILTKAVRSNGRSRLPRFNRPSDGSGATFGTSESRIGRRSQRSYLPGWIKSPHEPFPSPREDMRQRQSWEWRSRPESTVLGSPSLENVDNNWKTLMSEPPQVRAAPKAMLEMSGRPTTFGGEMQAELTQHLREPDASHGDSMIPRPPAAFPTDRDREKGRNNLAPGGDIVSSVNEPLMDPLRVHGPFLSQRPMESSKDQRDVYSEQVPGAD